jgi:hypothetical protein
MAKTKIRPMGQILLDLEEVIQKLCYKHDFKWGSILWTVRIILELDCPNAQEQYISGGSPVFYYGPLKNIVAYNKSTKSNSAAAKSSNPKSLQISNSVTLKTVLKLKSLIKECCDIHDLQWGDVFNLVKGYLEIHIPEAQESRSNAPLFYYGPSEGLTKSFLKQKRVTK